MNDFFIRGFEKTAFTAEEKRDYLGKTVGHTGKNVARYGIPGAIIGAAAGANINPILKMINSSKGTLPSERQMMKALKKGGIIGGILGGLGLGAYGAWRASQNKDIVEGSSPEDIEKMYHTYIKERMMKDRDALA